MKLLIESGADPLAETREGKVALCFAAAHSHMNALVYLMHQAHDTHGLMDDRKVKENAFLYITPIIMICFVVHFRYNDLW